MTLTKCVFPCWETPLKCYIRNSECHNKKLGHNGGDEKAVCITDKNTNNEQWYILPIDKVVIPNVNNNENDNLEIYCRIATSCDNNSCRLVINDESELTKRLYTCKGDKVEGDTDIWILRKSLNNEFYYLKSSDCSDLYLGCDDKTWLASTSDIVDENKSSYQWKLEVMTGELCYMKSKYLNKFLSCDSSGKLGVNQAYSPTEVWRFVEVGDTHNSVLIASLPSKRNVKYIISKPNGSVETSEEYSSSWARWVLEKSKCGTGIFVRSLMHNDKYLSIESNGRFYTTSIDNTVESVWQTGPAHENKFYISSSCSQYDIRVSCDASSGNIIGSNKRDKSTSWTVVADVESNTIYIQHIETKKWLGVTSNEKGDECPDPCLLNDKQENTEWFLGLASDNSMVIVSRHHSKWRLAYNGSFYMTKSDYEHATWHLEPIMPVADKGFNIMPIAIAATVSAVAAPVLFTAVVSGIGFTSVGVAGGSYAASMMSTAAIANGGGIAAGSTVALLQSVGAYGLGVFGTSVAVGSGAIVGAGSTTLMMSGMSQQQHDHTGETTVTSNNDEGTFIPQKIQNRPICSYELW